MAHLAIIAGALTTKGQVTQGPFWAFKMLLAHHSVYRMSSMSLQRKFGWAIYLMGLQDGLVELDASITTALEQIDDVGAVRADITAVAAGKLSTRFNPPFLVRKILLKSSGLRAAADGDDELVAKIQRNLCGRAPARRERQVVDDQPAYRLSKADFTEWACDLGGPLLAELACRHYVAYKQEGKGAKWVNDEHTAVAWGAAGGLLLLVGQPAGLAGPSSTFSARCGHKEAQAYFTSLIVEVRNPFKLQWTKLS